MHIFKKPIPACLSVAALAGLTKPTIIGNILKFICNIPDYVEVFEEVKKIISIHPQEDNTDETASIKQEDEEE